MCAGAGIDEVEVLDLLSALVARSLVVAEDAASGERRYRLLETIRQYAEERVDDAERAELRDRHAGFYADFAETAAQGLLGPDQLRWLLQVESELENLRAAMAWSVASNDAVRAARFLCAPLGGVPSPLSRRVAARRRSGTRPSQHPHDCALPVRARGRWPRGRLSRQARPSRAALPGSTRRRERAQRRTRGLYLHGSQPRRLCAWRRESRRRVLGARRRAPAAASAICLCSFIRLDGLASFRPRYRKLRRGRRCRTRGTCACPPDGQSRSDEPSARRARPCPRPSPIRNRAAR